jgi:hypothetical protein
MQPFWIDQELASGKHNREVVTNTLVQTKPLGHAERRGKVDTRLDRLFLIVELVEHH